MLIPTETVKGRSASPSEALTEAISNAVDAVGDDVGHANIIIPEAAHTTDGWTFTATIESEPNIVGAIKPKKKAAALAPKSDNDEKLKAKQRAQAAQLRHAAEEDELHRAQEEMAYEARHADEVLIVLYLQAGLEEVYDTVEANPHISSVHFVAEGLLWDAVSRYHPVFDLHDAAHQGGGASVNPLTGAESGPIAKIEPEKPKPGPKPRRAA